MGATRDTGNEISPVEPSDGRADLLNQCAEPIDPRVARSRAKMLGAATDLLVESGPRAVTVDAVAERSGVAKSTLYRHWESRTALIIDVIRSNMPQTGEPDVTAGFEPALHSIVRSLAKPFTNPEWVKILPALLSLKQHMPELQAITQDDHAEKIAALELILDLGVAEGALPAGLDPQTVAHLLFGPMLFAALATGVESASAVYDLAELTVERFIASYRT